MCNPFHPSIWLTHNPLSQYMQTSLKGSTTAPILVCFCLFVCLFFFLLFMSPSSLSNMKGNCALHMFQNWFAVEQNILASVYAAIKFPALSMLNSSASPLRTSSVRLHTKSMCRNMYDRDFVDFDGKQKAKLCTNYYQQDNNWVIKYFSLQLPFFVHFQGMKWRISEYFLCF